MANELFTYERVEAEQCIQGKFYDVPSASAAEQWAMALWARIMKGVQELYDEHGFAPPALVQRLLSSPPSCVPAIRISYGQLAQDPAAQVWYDANKENDLQPDQWFKYADDTKKIHFARAPEKATDGYTQCYRVIPSIIWKLTFAIEYHYSDDVVVRLNCQKRGGAHGHYGDRPPGMTDRSYACSTAIGFAVLHAGAATPLFPDKNRDVRRRARTTGPPNCSRARPFCAQGNWLPLLLICEGPQRVRTDAQLLPMPTHKALTKLEPLRQSAAAPSANGGEPAFRSTCEFDFQPTCICLKSHEENVLPTQITNFRIQERIATYSYALINAHEPSTEVVRILYCASESLVGLPAVLHTAQQPADWLAQPVLYDV